MSNESKQELMAVVLNESGNATIKEWGTAALKLSKMLHSMDAPERVQRLSHELSFKSEHLVQMFKAGVAETTPYTAIENILQSHWMLMYAVQKSGGSRTISITPSEFFSMGSDESL